MIDIIKTPKENAVLFNNSPIEIIVESILGADYYFNLQVRVNGADYDLQHHSKINDKRCVIDFKNDISDVFKEDYAPLTQNGVVSAGGLIKQVSLVIKEHKKTNNALVNELELPPFYLINSYNNTDLVLNKLTSLSVYDTKIKVEKGGKVRFPFFTNKGVQVVLKVNNVITETYNAASLNGVFFFNYDFVNSVVTPSDLVEFEIKETGTTTVVKRTLEFFEASSYNTSLLAFENNYSAWEYFYCFGEKETAPTYKRHLLKQNEEENYTYKVTRNDVFKINTGWFSQSYYLAVGRVIEALNFVVFENNKAVKSELTTKKEVTHKTKQYVYSQDLELKRNTPVVANDAVQYITPPSLVNIYASGIEKTPLEVLKAEFTTAFNGTSPHTIRFPILNTKGTVNIVMAGVSTPLDATVSYAFADFEKLVLTGSGFGNPYTSLKFNMENTQGKSNTATVFFELRMYDPLNKPPIISLASEYRIDEDVSIKSITAVVTEPDGDPYTVIWQQISGPQVTMQNTTTEVLTVTDFSGVGEYEFKITATDDRGNSSTATTILYIMDYKVNLGTRDNTLIIYGGKEGETVQINYTVELKIVSSGFVKLAGSNVLSLMSASAGSSESLSYVQPVVRTFTFPANGVIELPVVSNTVDGSGFPSIPVINWYFQIKSLSGNQHEGFHTNLYMRSFS